MEPENQLSSLQEPATESCSVPDESRPYIHTLLLWDPFYYYPLILCLPRRLFVSDFPTMILYAFLSCPMRPTYPSHHFFHV
jgi:hypothetical protein